MKTLTWAIRTAIRDARGSRTKAILYAMGMSLGIAALVAMGSFGADMDRAVREQTRNLLGSDLTIMSRQAFTPEVEAFVAKVPGQSAHHLAFVSMAKFAETDQTQLVRVRAVEDAYPFYGSLETIPTEAAQSWRSGPNILVDSSLMERTGARVGDQVHLGEKAFTIAGQLEKVPGDSAAASMMGPRVFIPIKYIEDTQLIRRGSRIFYYQTFKVPKSLDVDAFAASHESFFNQQRLRWDTVATREESLGESMANLTNFLNLIACLALLLGGLGVAGAVHYHVKQKVRQVATLRCIGATVRQVMAVYLIQVSLMALIAIVVGIALGVAIQFYLPRMVAAFLPFEFIPQMQPLAIAIAAGWGLLMSLLLAAAPLLALRKVSPAVSFRAELEPPSSDSLQRLVYGIVVVTWWAFAFYRTGKWTQATWFIGGLILGVALLYGTSRLLGWVARRVVSPRLPFVWRHGLSNLFRPHNQTGVFLIILGMGVFLITLLLSSRTMLLSKFENALQTQRANFIAFDIQSDQVDGVRETVESLDFPVLDLVPIVPMRLSSIKGQSIQDLSAELPDWAIQREYRSTYRGELVPTEKLVAGRHVGSVRADAEVIPVTLEDDIAEILKVELGDRMAVDVLGIPLELEVVGLRKIDWQSMQPNFFILFPEGILETAPQMYVMTTRTESSQRVAALQSAIVDDYANVSCLDLTRVVEDVNAILTKAAAVVRFLAGLCIVVGFVLLGSAIWNSRYERLGEHALLRTLGASRKQMAGITLIEYFLLGLFAALTGLVLALGAGWGIGTFLFEVPPFPQPLAILPPIILLPFMTLGLGYISMRSVWRVSPRLVLKQEM